MQLRKLSIAAALTAQWMFAQIEPSASKWKTWVVPDVTQIRLPAPPDAAASAAEIQTIKALMSESNADTRAQVAYWDSGSPGYRWMQLASQQMLSQNVPRLYSRAAWRWSAWRFTTQPSLPGTQSMHGIVHLPAPWTQASNR
jgi:hypothetical protein